MAPRKITVFQTLNQAKHHMNDGAQYSLFPEMENNISNDAEYWHYSDLYNLYGAPFLFAPHMDVHIWPKIQMPTQTTKRGTPAMGTPTMEFYNDHVVQIRRDYNINGEPHRRGKDKRMSRYACWSMVRDNPDMIFSRTYFISPIIAPNMNFEQMRKLNYQFARVHLRNQLANMERQVGGILNSMHANFSAFYHIINQAFFYGYTTQDIKDGHNIPNRQNDPLANYMGSASLDGRIRAIDAAISRFAHTRNKSTDIFTEIMYDELVKQRINIIKNHDISPERDIYPAPVSQVQSQLAKTERDFINKYSKQKLR